MRKLLILLTAMALALTACASETVDIDPSVGDDLSTMATEAESMVADLEAENPELSTALDALRTEATTVSNAVLAGEISQEDIDRLTSSFEDFQADLSAASASLDAETADFLTSFENEMEAAIQNLDTDS